VLEFIPAEGGEALWLDELEVGRVYRLVMSMVRGGLVRLDTGQLVGVAGAIERVPLLTHIGHVDQALPAYAERVHPSHIAAALARISIRGIRGFVAAAIGSGSRFHIGLEGLAPAAYEDRLDRALQEVHPGYRGLREQGRIGSLQVSYLPGGSLGRFEDHRLHTGGLFGELSERHIIDELTLGRLCEGWPD
jgi:hypothetical protein